MNTALAAILMDAARKDLTTREALAKDGSLFGGYHPLMRAIHDENAVMLEKIVNEQGWPSVSVVGKEAAEAAWLILQHAIGHPALLRRTLPLLQQLVPMREADPIQVAMLEDRIHSFEGKPQLYGTQFDWNINGEMTPLPYDDIDLVNERRAAIGLCTLQQAMINKQKDLIASNEKCPADIAAYKKEGERWLRETGWREVKR